MSRSRANDQVFFSRASQSASTNSEETTWLNGPPKFSNVMANEEDPLTTIPSAVTEAGGRGQNSVTPFFLIGFFWEFCG